MSQQIEITQIFDAPREMVYTAFTDPDELTQWFGPVDCRVPRDSIEIDARVGVHLRLVMTAPDVRSPIDMTFTEVVKTSCLRARWRPPPCPAWLGRCAWT